MQYNNLENLGLNETVLAESLAYGGLTLGRVCFQSKGIYRVICEGGELLAEISGKMRYNTKSPLDYPTVGDFVMLDRESDIGGHAVINHILKRKSVFVRRAAGGTNEEQVVAANVDTVFVCMSLNNDFNLRRLERYLTLAWNSGACPVVVLTKADLCGDLQSRVNAVEEIALGADIVVSSSIDKSGYDNIISYLGFGHTVALIGSSGVGKSTLINWLIGEVHLETNGLRNDDKGRHTTTHRELIALPSGGTVIDTPGMREVGMLDTSEGFEKSFEDVEQYFGKCKFRNCTHNSEPGCAVHEAIELGKLSKTRWEAYNKLKIEAVFADDKAGYIAQKTKKFKDIAKTNRKK